MSRTKAEVRAFLDSQVGQSVNAAAGLYRGQCVSLPKALLEFLGAPNPYASRGDAKDAATNYVNQGLAKNGTGWLNVVVNKDMGRLFVSGKWQNFGHIWIDLSGEANYEQNGAKALITTKNTRPISQGQQIVNLDQYIVEENIPMPTEQEVINQFNYFTDKPPESPTQIKYYTKRPWSVLNDDLLVLNRKRKVELQETVKSLNEKIKALTEAGTGKPEDYQIAGELFGQTYYTKKSK